MTVTADEIYSIDKLRARGIRLLLLGRKTVPVRGELGDSTCLVLGLPFDTTEITRRSRVRTGLENIVGIRWRSLLLARLDDRSCRRRCGCFHARRWVPSSHDLGVANSGRFPRANLQFRVGLLPVMTLESNRLDRMLETSSTDKTLDVVRPLDRLRAGTW